MISINEIVSGFNRSKLNEALQNIASYLNRNTLRRDGLSRGEDNSMRVDLDMNSYRILNLPSPTHPNDPVRLQDVERGVVIQEVGVEADVWKPTSLLEIAHRGYIEVGPQNSMLAFTAATKMGCKALECDVQITSDGVPVLYHDNTLDSLTDGVGAVSANTLAQVQAAQYDELAGTNLQATTSIPTFEEFLSFAKRAGMLVVPEIKAYRTQADIQLIVDLVEAYGMEDTCVLQSFNFSDLEYVRGVNDNIRIGFLGGSSDPAVFEPVIDNLQTLGKGGVIWSFAAIDTNPNIVRYASDRGVFIQAYTIRDISDMEKMFDAGVYALITDTPLGAI